uniref:Chloride channel CLIC-like protein 1 n=1 Tax=Cacopsylla melanoneura TaxID=428564 RepID=A0A8D8LV24_9HEMI
MAGLLNISWFLFALVLFIDVTVGWSVWSDPELAVIEPKKNREKKEVTVEKEVTVDKNSRMISSDPTLSEMKIAIGKLMFVSGMQNFNLPPGERRSVALTMNLNDMDLNDINTFLRNPNQMNMMKVAKVMQRIFSPHTSTSKEEKWFKDEKTIIQSKERWVQIIFNIIISCMNKETMLVVTCLIMAVFIVRAMLFGADIRVVIGLFFVAVFFAGFLWNWSYMYQKAVVDQFVKRQQYSKYASGCIPDGGFWSFVTNLFGYAPTLDECTEFYRATSIDPLIMVPPTIALSETLSMFVIHPAVLMAESMQKITRILFGNQMLGMYIGTPLVMIIFGGMFVFLFIMLTGRRIKFKLMYIGTFEVGSQFENYYHPLPSNRTEHSMIQQKPEDQGPTISPSADTTTNAPRPSHNANSNTETNSKSSAGTNSKSNAETKSNCSAETKSNSTSETNSSSTLPCSSNPTTDSQNPSTSTCRVGHSCVSPSVASVPTCSMVSCCGLQPVVNWQQVSCPSYGHTHTGGPFTGYQFHSSPTRDHIWRNNDFRNQLDTFRNLSSEDSRNRMFPLGDVTNHWANVDSMRNLRQRRNVSNKNEQVEDTLVMFRRRKLSI